MKRYCYWDNMKFILMVFVVIEHFIDNPAIDGNRFSQAFFVFIYSFCMPVFLFVSGLFLKYDSAHKLRWDRVIYYILIGYFMKAGMWFMEWIAGGDPNWSWFSEGNVPWYMFVTAGYLILVYVIKSLSPKLVLPLAVAVSLAAGYFNFIGDFLCLSKFLVFFPFFYAGYCFTPQKVENFLHKKAVRITGLVVTFMFGIFCFAFTERAYLLRPVFASRYSYSEMDFSYIGIFLRIFQYLIAVFMIIGISALVPQKRIKFFTGAGSRTIPIYFIHYFLVRLCTAVDLQMILVEKLSYFGVILLIGIAFAVTCLLAAPIFDLPFKTIQRAIAWIINKIKDKKVNIN